MFDLTQLFLGTAHAADAVAPAAISPLSSGSALMQYAPLILIFFVFYFLLIRPQQKRQEAQMAMLKALKKGDKVITGGGFVGTITKEDGDNYLIVEIANGVQVKAVRATVSGLVDDTKPDVKKIEKK